MSMIGSMRGMIGQMYAVYAIDLGVQLGLFNHLAKSEEPVAIGRLAEQARCKASDEMMTAWMRAVQAAGVLNVDESDRVSFNDGWREALTDPASTDYIATLPRCYIALGKAYRHFARLFREGRSMAWQELGRDVVEDISADGVRAANFFIEVVSKKIPTLREKLKKGVSVCDVGCGAGHITLRLAEAFPNCTFTGIDPWEDAIDLARQHAKQSGVGDRVKFETMCATKLTPNSYDVVMLNDVLHEMDTHLRSPALRAIHNALRPGAGMFFSDPVAPGSHADFLRESSKIPAITLFFESPFGAKVHVREELETLLRDAGFGAMTEVESSDTDLSAYFETKDTRNAVKQG